LKNNENPKTRKPEIKQNSMDAPLRKTLAQSPVDLKKTH